MLHVALMRDRRARPTIEALIRSTDSAVIHEIGHPTAVVIECTQDFANILADRPDVMHVVPVALSRQIKRLRLTESASKRGLGYTVRDNNISLEPYTQ